ncbi:MAG: glucose 1-dehydrogenase [Phycisphaera sp.]|nr:glucose 1-dehydrogenase [Phycisphaera sp.]
MSHNLFDLSGKVAIVTGASRGLGQQFALALARAGADLVITSRNVESLTTFKSELEGLGRRVLAVQLDVRDFMSIQTMAEAAHKFFGKLDILVNNAGCNVRKPALEVTPEDWDMVMDTNLRGAFFVAQAVGQYMVDRRYGRVINIGSVTCVSGYAGLAPYCASRGGVKQLTMSLADDWGPHGVTVNCLAPGWFKTAQNAVLYQDAEWVEYITDRIPLNRPGQPHDLDGAVVFLASDASAYITGQTLLVDGGISTGSTHAVPKRKGAAAPTPAPTPAPAPTPVAPAPPPMPVDASAAPGKEEAIAEFREAVTKEDPAIILEYLRALEQMLTPDEVTSYRQYTYLTAFAPNVKRVDELCQTGHWMEAKRFADEVRSGAELFEEVAALPAKIAATRTAFKDSLLKNFKEAFDREDMQRAMALLEEMDKTLTPEEAAPYAEMAREVLHAKKENLGVRFKMSMEDKDWIQALRVGEQLVKEFPNSAYAKEVEGMINKLRERAARQMGGKH